VTRAHRIGTILALLLSCTTGAWAATYNWIGALGSNWETDGNWSIAGWPSVAGDVVNIGTSAPNPTVLATNLGVYFASINISGTGSLTLNAGIQVGATTLTMTGGTLSGGAASQAYVQDDLIISGGAVGASLEFWMEGSGGQLPMT
jgi:hypothetical protein